MHSSYPDHLGAQPRSQSRQDYLMNAGQSRVGGIRSEDSWIDLASQPATSSTYSTGCNEIVTNRSHSIHNERAGPRTRSHETSQDIGHPASADGSSQDEYEESESEGESESDQVMSSSNEEITRVMEDEDQHDRTTTVGSRLDEPRIFTPQPNAFSHPPISNNVQSAPAPNSYFPAYTYTTYSDRLPSNRMVTNRAIAHRQHFDGRLTGPRSQPDHDAALRASLTTLLSCAAAVRPKRHHTATTTAHSSQPRTLRLVPESQLPPNQSPNPIVKRKSRDSSKERQIKKARAHRSPAVNVDPISPTLMTWMISAGVVLVFSAISFSAGYAWGKEAAGFDGEVQCTSCGREAIRATGGGGTLRRLRWSSTSQSIRA